MSDGLEAGYSAKSQPDWLEQVLPDTRLFPVKVTVPVPALAATVVNRLKGPPFKERSITKPVSVVALSVQVSLTLVWPLIVTPTRFVGAGGAAVKVTLAEFE